MCVLYKESWWTIIRERERGEFAYRKKEIKEEIFFFLFFFFYFFLKTLKRLFFSIYTHVVVILYKRRGGENTEKEGGRSFSLYIAYIYVCVDWANLAKSFETALSVFLSLCVRERTKAAAHSSASSSPTSLSPPSRFHHSSIIYK